MNVPAGFRKWPFHWFKCPACGHRSFHSLFKVSASVEPAGLPLRFWCQRCGEYSTLKRPSFQPVLGLLALALAAIIFVVFYNALVGSLFGLPFLWALASGVTVAVVSPVLICALSRLTNRYAQAPRVEP